MSPFLEFKRKNERKLYKSNKNGFEKSLGAKKFKLDMISYEMDTIADNIVENLRGFRSSSVGSCLPESIFIIGAKSTLFL